MAIADRAAPEFMEFVRDVPILPERGTLIGRTLLGFETRPRVIFGENLRGLRKLGRRGA